MSTETEKLKLFKWDTSNEIDLESDFDIEKTLNENWDKIDKNAKEVNTNISNINSKNTELEKELKEAQEDFYQNSIRGQASGEYIHVEDSSNCRARIGIGGNSEQETSTQGRNYFTGNKIEGGTNLGATYSFDNSILKLNGTTTNKGNILEKISTKVILPPGNYKFRAGLYAGSFERNSKDMAIYLSNKEDFVTGAYVSSGITLSSLGSVGSFTITENTELYVSIFVNDAGLVLNNTQLAILIAKAEKDENIGTFEQFTPDMPSPDYPSPIKAVGSNVNLIEETFKGYNLNGHGVFEVSSSFNMQIAKVKANVKYTLNAKTNVLGYYNEKPTLTSVTYNNSRSVLSGDTDTFVATKDGYIAIRTMSAEKVKLVEGTEVGEYSKLGQGCVKVTKCNENILDTSITKNVKNQNGEERIGYFCQITKTGKYYLMLNTANTLYFGKSTDLNSATTLIGSTSSTFSTTYNFNEGEYFVLWGTKTEKDKIMVILSNKQQKYIEHQEQSYIMPVQQPMRAIGDTRDTFIKKDGKWHERHYIARRIFNGIANKFNSKHSSIYTDARGFYQLNLPGKTLGTNGSVAYGKSNYLKYKNVTAQGAIYQDCLWWENTSNYNYASMPFLSLTEANEWLVKLNDNGNPFYIDYVLAEPLDIECTEEQSRILDELNNARTYKNVTNITTDSIAILDLDYAKDLETLLNNTQALAVNNASEGV